MARMPRTSWLYGIAALFLTYTLFFGIAGPLTYDSGTYHLSAQSLVTTGDFFIDNGFEEFPSPMLGVGQIVMPAGQLVSQYPEYYTILSAPFYAVFDYRGLMILSTLAFIGTTVLIWRMTSWFSKDVAAPLSAVLIYAFATFSWEYTQSSYPHMVNTFLILLACWLAWGAALREDDLPKLCPGWMRGPVGRAGLAGLIIGLAIGVRLDAAFAAAALGLPFLTGRGLRWRELAAMAGGALPMIAGLTWINYEKFGVINPFSYGRLSSGGYASSLSYYLPVAAALLGIALLFAFRDYIPERLNRKRLIAGIGAIGVAAIALTPTGYQFGTGVFQLLIDMRIRPEIPEPALTRSPNGAVIYFQSVKKALVESLPYLSLLIIPALATLWRGENRDRSWLLWLVPISFLSFYGYLAWHGSIALNMRYLTPVLPFLAILTALQWVRVREALRPATTLLLIAALWVGFSLAFVWALPDIQRQEAVFLNGALALAGLCLVLQLVSFVRPAIGTRVYAIAFLAALAWSSAVTLVHDYRMSASVRYSYLSRAETVGQFVDPDAVILSVTPNLIWPLRDWSPEIIVADFKIGTQDDTSALVSHFSETRPVYWVSIETIDGWDDRRPETTPEGVPITFSRLNDETDDIVVERLSVGR